ncbi:phosphate/phosphite/phosphonate ABC transporter substrate-binding protein [Pseudomonas aeruginosa]|uniref:phosphate/phosphite/phosphonate ABC transporter substrate-binding protein n=1 Tax=Pseudomonas aeruginosa TaxID=287 RepID=UPI0034D26B81
MPESVIASLHMYTRPPCVEQASEALIEEVLSRLGYARREMDTNDMFAHWLHPSLLFAHTCGYPYMTRLRDQLSLLAAPVYTLPGCEGIEHCSFLVVSAADGRSVLVDYRDQPVALNALDSNSGMNLMRHAVAPLSKAGRFFSSVQLTGAHLQSLAAVASGRAAIAAIDAVTYGYLARYSPELVEPVRVLCETARSPVLPVVTRKNLDVEKRAALIATLNEVLTMRSDIAETLALKGFAPVTELDYQVILDYQQQAISLGYPEIA